MTDLMESLQRHCTDLTIDKKDRHWHGQIFGEGGGMNLIVGGIKDGGCKGFHPSGPNYAGN